MTAFAFFYTSLSATCDYSQPAIVHVLENGAKQSSMLLGGQDRASEVRGLVQSASNYKQAIARVLPIDEEADALVAPLFSKQPTRRRPIARR